MKTFIHSLSAASGLSVLLMITLFAPGIQAAAKMTLSGKATEVKYETDAGISISLIDWSAEEQQVAVENAWRQYRDDGDLETFLDTVEAQESRGYLFTAAATGYRIKYAWKEDTADGQRMTFLVMPGLKTRNPYLWQSPNNDSPEFTLVQVHLNEETGVAKTSLEGGIVFNEDGKLVLDRFDDLRMFATVEDSTPYYLK